MFELTAGEEVVGAANVLLDVSRAMLAAATAKAALEIEQKGNICEFLLS